MGAYVGVEYGGNIWNWTMIQPTPKPGDKTKGSGKTDGAAPKTGGDADGGSKDKKEKKDDPNAAIDPSGNTPQSGW